MTSKTNPGETTALSLKAAFDIAHVKRQAEIRRREEAERQQQEEDLGRAEELYDAIVGDPEFLAAHGLTVDWRRYRVSLESADFRISAYFEAGRASVTAGDKRTAALPDSPAPRKQEMVDSVADALRVMAQYLVDETR
jgi:hypothetical protein